jgi:hypothetical protein
MNLDHNITEIESARAVLDLTKMMYELILDLLYETELICMNVQPDHKVLA